jgi:hypothetical protein
LLGGTTGGYVPIAIVKSLIIAQSVANWAKLNQ